MKYENKYDFDPLNRLAKEHSPKTIHNYHSFISAVLGTFCSNLKISAPLCCKKLKIIHIFLQMMMLNGHSKQIFAIRFAACFSLSTLHKLRHYFASKMSAMNIPEADIMRMWG